jgi:uncharacterized integral membrane protein
MNNLWLKIKVWTKIALAAFIVIYLVTFIAKNSAATAHVWFFFFREPYTVPLLYLIFFVFFAGVIGTILVRTTFKTINQVTELRNRNRQERLEREMADMKAKAARLQTRPGTAVDDQIDSPHDVL